ncbi:MAG: SPFH domain-containing protein [Candidatus Competibacteraceae bacterium]
MNRVAAIVIPGTGGGRDQGPPDLDDIRKLSEKFGALLGGRRVPLMAAVAAPGTPGSGFEGIGLVVGAITLIELADRQHLHRRRRQARRRFAVRALFGYDLARVRICGYSRLIEWKSLMLSSGALRRSVTAPAAAMRQPAVRTMPKALMLTQDENIVDVRLAVQYQVRIKDPRAYLFNVLNPDDILVQVVESATRQTIGKSTIDFALTEGRSDIAADIKMLSQRILDSYGPNESGAGLQIITVVLQDVQPPEEVQDAFADAIKAREDQQRVQSEAEACIPAK